jgi:hypothetical protein
VKSSPQLKYQVPHSKILFRFPIELNNLVMYLDQKRTQSEIDITFSHVAVKVCAMILNEMPALNGHITMGNFYRNKTPAVDVSVSIEVHEAQSVMMKVADADAKPVEYIAEEILNHAKDLRNGDAAKANPIVQRLQSLFPAIIGAPIRQQLYKLGAQYGISIPALDIQPFPQGVCSVVSSPTADNAVDFDIAVVTDNDSASAPITVTMGGLRIMPTIEGDKEKKLMGSRVLNFAISISTKAASLGEARRFCSKFQQYMNDPFLIDKLHEKAEFDRVEAAKRKSAFGSSK